MQHFYSPSISVASQMKGININATEEEFFGVFFKCKEIEDNSIAKTKQKKQETVRKKSILKNKIQDF